MNKQNLTPQEILGAFFDSTMALNKLDPGKIDPHSTMRLHEVREIIGNIIEDKPQRNERSIKDRAIDALNSIEQAHQNIGTISGLSTGLGDLDMTIDGLQPGEIFVVASRPCMGKTSFVVNVCEQVAVVNKLPVAVFSLESSGQDFVNRLLCLGSQVSLRNARSGYVDNEDFNKLTVAAATISERPIFIDDTPAITFPTLKAEVRRLKEQKDIRLVCIDNLHQIRLSSRRPFDCPGIEISEILNELKVMAVDLEIPILLTAQLNRNPERRMTPFPGCPKLCDLRDSDAIEYYADTICLLYRPEYYADDQETHDREEGKLNLLVAKQRNGPTGWISLNFRKEFGKFENRVGAE